jgi:type VI protein secretion system component Hcp
MSDVLMVSDSFKGETNRHGQADAIDVQSVSFGASRQKSGAARPTAAASFTSIFLTTPFDSGAAELFAIAAVGRIMDEVVVMQFRAGGPSDDTMIWSLTMSDVLVASFNLSGGGDALPVTSIELSYRKGDLLYMPQNVSGGSVDPILFSFDLSAID